MPWAQLKYRVLLILRFLLPVLEHFMQKRTFRSFEYHSSKIKLEDTHLFV